MSEKVEITPTVLLNMSDHYTRVKVGCNKSNVRCVGGLLGQMEGRKMRVMQTFEFKSEINPQNLEISSIDLDFVRARVDLFRAEMSGNLFKDYELLGWYSAGVGMNAYPSDLKFQHQLSLHFQMSPIYLMMDTVSSMKNKTDLPLKLYELKYEQTLASDQHKVHTHETFVELAYDILTSKADSITIESIAKSYTTSVQSQFAENLKTTLNAVSRFSEKIQTLIKALDNPILSSNPSLLLELNQILSSFPQQFHESLDDKVLEHYSDANIISFLSALSAANRVISNVSDHKSSFKQQKNIL